MASTNQVAALGELVLLLTLVVTVYAGAASIVGARLGARRLIRSGIWAAYGSAALLTLASSVIFFAILSNDYSIKYVHHYSDATMPWFYKITSYWGGLDGSMMFWAWVLSLFAALALYVNRERHRELVPWVNAVLMGVLTFFLLLIIFAKRPFDVYLAAAPTEGKGLNPLLQNPYMATHPPALYIGLVSAAVPFGFAMAALITGNLDDTWLRSVRRWVLLSWIFLSLGLTLGMLWAYEVLGWGGYWGWDPVENAGALAWFTETAFLHSIMIQERRGMFKVWNVFLLLTSFLLTLIATFLTRSGIVQSVHAFGSDPVLKVSFLAFMSAVTVLGYGLLVFRLPRLRSRGELDSWVSREFAFLLNNWILLGAANFILVATLFPTLSEAVTGTRVTLASPFYNLWMAPIGLLLLLLTGVGPLIAWRRASPKNLAHQFMKPVVFAVIVVGGLAFIPGARVSTPLFSDKLLVPAALINFGLCAFVLGTIVQEFYRGTRVRQAHTRLDFFTSLVGLVARNKRRYGGYLVHVGVVLMFIGFGGGAYKRESEVTLTRGQKTQIGRYTVEYTGLRLTDRPDKKAVTADVNVFGSGKLLKQMEPAKWFFAHHEEEPVTNVQILRGLDEDLYLVLNGFDLKDKDELVNFKLVIHPLVNWLWIGFIFLSLGTAVCFLPEHAYSVAAQAATKASDPRALGAALLGLLLLGSVVARADAPVDAPKPGHSDTGTVVAPPRTPEENTVFHKLVCMCGTCGRELLADCTCGTAKQMRDEVSTMLKRGMSVEQVLDAFVARFPTESPLAAPPDSGFNRLAWVFPYIALLGGVGVLALLARRFAGRGSSADAQAPSAAPASSEERSALEDRLDDELDALD